MEENTLYSPFTLIPLEKETTASDYLLQKARDHAAAGKEKFIIDSFTGESFNYDSFEENTGRIASAFYKRGMRKGDTLIFLSSDMVKHPMLLTGVWRANGIVRASYPEDTAETLLSRVQESRAGWIYCDNSAGPECLEVAGKVPWKVEVIVAGKSVDNNFSSIYDLLQDDGTEIPNEEISSGDPALVLCTSGTTGMSKGAVLTHSAFVNQIRNTTYFAFQDGKPNLLMSKATHISGCMFPLSILASGKLALVLSTINRLNVLEALSKFKPAFVWGFPPFLLQLINDPDAHKDDFTSLEYAGIGGAPVTTLTVDTLMKLPNMKVVFNAYGLTEIAPVATHLNFEDPERRNLPGLPIASMGKLVHGNSAQIRDLETNKALGPNAVGEICVKSNKAFSYYINNPEGTKNAFVDGYFKTGDLGYYDENGFLFLVDRAKEVFKYLSNHVAPAEIELVISEHPAVAEVCVIGIQDPNGGGHIPRAFVTLKTTHNDLEPAAIVEFANAKLANYKHIRGGVYFVPELPRGKTGKISRQLVAELKVRN